jgi:hypothetical protein
LSKIFLDDPQALEKCEIKMQKLIKEKAYWKGLKPEPRNFQVETDNMKRSYMLPLCNQNIRDLKIKIEKIQSLQKNNVKLERKAFWHDGIKMFKYVKKETDQNDQ